MAKGTRVLVTSRPRGHYETVKIAGTPKPGTCMEIDPSVADINGVFTYQVYGTQAASGGQGVSADGDRKRIAILTENDTENKTMDDAYVAGDFAVVYHPAMGEQFNMILVDVSGTGDTFVVGEELMVEDGSGKLLTADSDAEAHPFTLLEEVATAPTADHIRHVIFNGEGGA